MNITSNSARLVRDFSDVKASMSRMDGNLTQWERHGRTYPNYDVDDSFRGMARDLDDATLSLSDMRPDQDALLTQLKSDTLTIAFHAGMTDAMSQHATTFGSGWRNLMDPSIDDAQQAIDLLTLEQGGETEKTPPTPMQVLRALSDVRSELDRWDASFTQWEHHGRTYPSRSVSGNLLSVAGRLYDARNDFRELYPEQTSLINDLQGDIFKVAGDAGMTKHMNNHRNNFGNGWSRSLDHSIESVRRAIDVVIAGQSPEGGNDYEAKGE